MAAAVPPLEARDTFDERFTFGWVFTPVWVACEFCRKATPSDIVWKCGYCGEVNDQTKSYSFLNECRKCETAPKSFYCTHCCEINCLDSTGDKSNPALKLGMSLPPPVPPPAIPKQPEPQDPHTAELRELQKRQQLLTQQIAVARLKAELDKWKPARKKSIRKRLEESIAEYQGQFLTAREIYEREKRANEEKYKDDPEMLEQANQVLEDWYEREM
jgi:hypothetical protein